MSSIPRNLSKEVVSAFDAHSEKYGSKIKTILTSVFSSFISNEASLSSKFEELAGKEEADIESLNNFYNSILKLVTFVYKERYTVDQLEAELADLGKTTAKN